MLFQLQQEVGVDIFSCKRSLQSYSSLIQFVGLIYSPARGVFRDAGARVDIFTSRNL
jgi:hypothetical protein